MMISVWKVGWLIMGGWVHDGWHMMGEWNIGWLGGRLEGGLYVPIVNIHKLK